MPEELDERRGTDPDSSDSGRRRRATDKEEDFALFRDKVLLGIGALIVNGIALAAVIGNIRNPEVALAALTVGGGLLGAPTILRWDEKARRRK
jgi:hypothetical protein